MRSLTLVALIAVPAFAQTLYSWEDAEGVHYTDDLSQVPKDQKKVEGRVLDARPVSKGLSAPVQVAVAPAPPPQPSHEAQWRERFITAHRRIATVRATLAALRSSLPPRTECVPQPLGVAGTTGPRTHLVARCQINPLYDQLQVQLAQEGVELKNAELDLEQLERDASLAAVPREWRRGW